MLSQLLAYTLRSAGELWWDCAFAMVLQSLLAGMLEDDGRIGATADEKEGCWTKRAQSAHCGVGDQQVWSLFYTRVRTRRYHHPKEATHCTPPLLAAIFPLSTSHPFSPVYAATNTLNAARKLATL